MKMTLGTGTIDNYGSYISNCRRGQMPYKIPVNSLSDVQLYVELGNVKPSSVLIQLISTCGPDAGNVEVLTTSDYIVGQTTEPLWYAVFKTLLGADIPTCFVIAISFTIDTISGPEDRIYFSEEYCIENNCAPLTLIKGCYGNLASELSYDCEGIYFGLHYGDEAVMGDETIAYQHQLLLRGVEVELSAIKNTFKQGRTRTFRTEKEKIYQFYAELVPAWYLAEIDAVFYRGEVYIGDTKYLVNETQFEKVEDCKKIWKPAATFKDSCFKSFSCEIAPCDPPPQECCDPSIISVEVTDTPNGTTMNTTIIIHARVGAETSVTGTSLPVTGITAGSTVIACAAFAGVRVKVERGHIPVYILDESEGTTYYTKNIADAFITLSDPLVENELLYIETIPA